MNKVYHVRTQEDFNALMEELEEQGCLWLDGNMPTQRLDFWKFLSKGMSIRVDNNKSLTFCDRNHFQSKGYEITEYKEALSRATIEACHLQESEQPTLNDNQQIVLECLKKRHA